MLQAAHDREKQELEAALNADVNAISREVEAELARIEAEGGKAAESVSCAITLSVSSRRCVSATSVRLSTWIACGIASRT